MDWGNRTSAVTFVFTDIEGSTRLWETQSALMAAALARHDELCRSAVRTHGGHLVKMTGDGLHAVFDDPSAAVASVLELQRGMDAIGADCGIPFKMRCGLHAGVSQVRDGDYFGSAVNRAARIMSAGHGGQILLSQTVVELAKGRLPAGTDLLHLGRVRLRDLSTPEDIWQLLHADLCRNFPELRSLDLAPNNLPQQQTSFVGREKEIAEVKSLLETTRLLTLIGAGGCGKTRLALHVAADLLEANPDGAWLVELVPLGDPALVPQRVAAVLGLKEEAGKNLTQTLTEHLKSSQLLLLLDNAEHLLDACSHLAEAVLRNCPQVRLLVTSRQRLGIAGELSYRVPSLTVPDAKLDATPERLAAYESTRLFVERAQQLVPRFTVTEHNAPALASVCRRLDGIPLAIELAAARVRAMSVEEVNQRLDQRFRLVTGGSRTAPRRQQTLRALIEWSYELLDDAEKALLGRVSTFSGGWTLEAAEGVCAGMGIDDWEVLDLLTSLADKSLVVAEDQKGATRYGILETVWEYARDALRDRGEEAQWRGRHLAYFLAFAEAAEPQLTGAEQQVWLERLESEHDNVRSALAWSSAAGGDAVVGLRLAGALWRFWFVRGHFGEGRGWLTAALAAAPSMQAAAARAKALHGSGSLAKQQGDFSSARALLEASVEIKRALGDRRGIASSLNNLANVVREQADYPAARRLYNECLAIDREQGDRLGIAASLGNLGAVAFDQGDHQAARALHEESLAIFREVGEQNGIALALGNLGDVAFQQGDNDTARRIYEQSLAIKRQLGDRWGIAFSLSHLGNVARDQLDLPAAGALFRESLAIRRELGDREGIASSLINVAVVAREQGDHISAAALDRESLTIRHELGDRRGIAVALEGLGYGAIALEAPIRGVRLLSIAERLREEIGAPRSPKDRPGYQRALAAARAAIGDDATFDRTWHEGRTMTLDQAMEFALTDLDA